jgi:hypothetical protein
MVGRDENHDDAAGGIARARTSEASKYGGRKYYGKARISWTSNVLINEARWDWKRIYPQRSIRKANTSCEASSPTSTS